MQVNWKTAIMATLHCLTGCAIGEILGMIIGNAFDLHGLITIVLSTGLAFFFGYLLSMLPLLRSGLSLKSALGIAFAADTFSIMSMEFIDNLIMWFVPGAMNANLTDLLFWGTLILALAIAFIFTVPLNYWLISHGKGHAIAHKHHDHMHHD